MNVFDNWLLSQIGKYIQLFGSRSSTFTIIMDQLVVPNYG